MTGDQGGAGVDAARRRLDGLDHWEPAQIEGLALCWMRSESAPARVSSRYVWRLPVRRSPPLFESIAALGRDATFDRLAATCARLTSALIATD